MGHGLWGPRGSATSSTYRGARLSGGTGISGKTDRALKQSKRGIGALSKPAWSALPRVAASRLPPCTVQPQSIPLALTPQCPSQQGLSRTSSHVSHASLKASSAGQPSRPLEALKGQALAHTCSWNPRLTLEAGPLTPRRHCSAGPPDAKPGQAAGGERGHTEPAPSRKLPGPRTRPPRCLPSPTSTVLAQQLVWKPLHLRKSPQDQRWSGSLSALPVE